MTAQRPPEVVNTQRDLFEVAALVDAVQGNICEF
jgi:hypothetical protein